MSLSGAHSWDTYLFAAHEWVNEEEKMHLSTDHFNKMAGIEQEPNTVSSENNLMGLKTPSGRLGTQWAVMVVTDSDLDLFFGIENVSIHSQMS